MTRSSLQEDKVNGEICSCTGQRREMLWGSFCLLPLRPYLVFQPLFKRSHLPLLDVTCHLRVRVTPSFRNMSRLSSYVVVLTL